MRRLAIMRDEKKERGIVRDCEGILRAPMDGYTRVSPRATFPGNGRVIPRVTQVLAAERE